MNPQTPFVATVLCLSLLAAIAAQQKVDISKLPPPSEKKGVTYATDIKPVFQKTCVKCHGPEKQKAKLRLDNLEFALKGSDNGSVIVAGDSAKSKLVHNIARLGAKDDFMPPPGKGDQLSKEQVGLIRAWIDQGAK
jgi:mono/diheme cytochrome c family protein